MPQRQNNNSSRNINPVWSNLTEWRREYTPADTSLGTPPEASSENPPVPECHPEPMADITPLPLQREREIREEEIKVNSIVKIENRGITKLLFYVLSVDHESESINVCFIDAKFNLETGQRRENIIPPHNCFDMPINDFSLFFDIDGESDLTRIQCEVVKRFLLLDRINESEPNSSEDTFQFIGRHPDQNDRVDGYAPKRDEKGFQEKDFLED